jgi:ABC-type dipeptide/oligopeptide/nickel transport system permease subunit
LQVYLAEGTCSRCERSELPVRLARWVLARLAAFLALLVGTLMLFSLPAMITSRGLSLRGLPVAYQWTPGRWLSVVWFHLSHLARGQILPPLPPAEYQQVWSRLSAEWAPALLTTLNLVSWALAGSLTAGILAGWVLSRSSAVPPWLRRSVGGATGVLQSLPDLVIATALNLGLVLAGRLLGRSWRAPDLVFWQHFLAPVLAMTLMAAPYVARVAAAAIDEVSGQLYVRTALAKGLSAWRVTVRHVGKNVLIQVWSILPVVTGLLLSAAAIVEYLMDIRGAGRALVVAITNPLWFTEPFVAVLYLFPFVAVYAMFAASADGTLHVLDPRLGGEIPQARAAPPIWRRLSWPWLSSLHPASLLRRVFRTLRGAAGTAPWLWAEWHERLPERLQAWRRAFRDPVLLAGLLLVLALVLVAILAPALAPYAPDRRFLPFQAPDGQIWAPPYGPNPQHLLGVDDLGRDRLSRLIVGTRYALAFAAAVVPAKFLLALAWGWLSASRGGLWSRLLDWFTILLTAIPQILLPLMLIRVFNVALTGNIMGAVIAGVLVVALPGIPRLAASFRQQFREVLIQPFLEGAVAVGASPGRILFAHVLPQLRAPLISMAVMEIPLTMTLTATLAYFRTPPGGWIAFQDGGGAAVIPEWGSMLDDPLVLIFAGKWWLWTPFLALVVAVAAFSLLGEGVKRTSGTH